MRLAKRPARTWRALGTLLIAGGALPGLAGCDSDGFWCGNATCGDSANETAQIVALGELPLEAPLDTSNKYAKDPGAADLGKQLFHDKRFSGPTTALDSIGRAMPFGRTPKGQAAGVACVSCHDPARGSIDSAPVPGNVSVGAGWTFSNALPTFNSAFYTLLTWNGRVDSLWAQAVADNENALTTNGNRLHTAWLIADLYRASYERVFAEFPLPMKDTAASWQTLVVPSDMPLAGQCKLSGTTCPDNCRPVMSTKGDKGCWPRFPLEGKPGKTMGCQSGDAAEPFGDAYDCMDAEDQRSITRVLVNFGKAIAAYETTLVSRPSPFDRWVGDLKAGNGDNSTAVSEMAKLGARIFVGKGACNDCHSTALLSDNLLHNIGVEQVGAAIPTEADCPAGGTCDCAPTTDMHVPKNCIPWGARDGIDKLQQNKYRRDSVWSDNGEDASRIAYVHMPVDTVPKGAYRTPSLRNVELTAPYMHNGSIATLEKVVDHYVRGGSVNTPGARAASIKPLFLSPREQEALVAFLKSLTSDPMPAELTTPPALP